MKEQAVKINFDDLNSLPKFLQMVELIYAGKDMAKKQGFNLDLEKVTKRLEAFSIPDQTIVAHWGAGLANYGIASIYTQLGELDKAIIYLKKSKDLGMPTMLSFYEYDSDLEPLYDRPDFQELIKPVWPGIKD